MNRRYRMLLKIDGEWECVNTIVADDHLAALREAIAPIEPARYDKPLRIEEDVSPVVTADPPGPERSGVSPAGDQTAARVPVEPSRGATAGGGGAACRRMMGRSASKSTAVSPFCGSTRA